MGIDVGFDLYSPLKHTNVDQWSRFLQALCTEFASDAVVVVKEDEIEFQAGEHPLPCTLIRLASGDSLPGYLDSADP